MLAEKDIVYSIGNYWILADRNAYTVYSQGVTHSKADSSYPKTKDGLSIAIARANYINRRAKC